MRITVKATKLELTPALQAYIDAKLGALAKFIKKFDEDGAAEMRCEVARTTKHHRHGEVFMAEANLRLPKRLIRAAAYDEDARKAIDAVKRTLRLEIEKYKTKREE